MEFLPPSDPYLSPGGTAINANLPLDLSDESSRKKGLGSGDSGCGPPDPRSGVEDPNQKKRLDAKEIHAFDNDIPAGVEEAHFKSDPELCSDVKVSLDNGNVAIPADGNSCADIKDNITLVAGDLQLVEIPAEKVMSECRVSSSETQNEDFIETAKRQDSENPVIYKVEGNFDVKTEMSCAEGIDDGKDSCEKIEDGCGNTDFGAIENVLLGKRKRGRPRKYKDDASQCSAAPPAAKPGRPVRNKVSSRSRNDEANGSLCQTCVGCGDFFKTQTQLDKHELICEFLVKQGPKTRLVKGYTCPLCCIDCTSRPGLKQHLLKTHPKSNSFVCPFCGVEFAPVHKFVQHFHRHLKSQGSQKTKKPFLAPVEPLSQGHQVRPSDGELPPAPSTFHCFQCNKSVKNDHSLAVHMLLHNVNRSLKVNQDFVTDVSSLGTYMKSLNDYKVFKQSKSQSLSPETFPCVSSDLVTTINYSFEYVMFTLGKLKSVLHWDENGTPAPKCTTDLIEKLNTVSVMSSGVSEISHCLSQLLGKGGQLDENPLPKVCNQGDNLFVQVKEELLEDTDNSNERDENGLDCETDSLDQPKSAVSDGDGVSSSRSKKTNEHVCNICGQVLSSSAILKRHKLIHEDTKPHKCKICSKAFRRSNHLKKHYSVHSVAGVLQCNLCEYRVKKVSSLLKHLADKHNKVVEEHGDLESNSKTNHDSSKKEEAAGSNCDDLEAENNELENEDKNDEDWIQEDDDDDEEETDGDRRWTKIKIIRRKRSVQKDTESRSRKGPFICGECGVELAHLSSFLRHKMIHQNRKPYQCQQCHKVFRRKHQLTRHSMVHAKRGSKYKCELCDFLTNSRTTLEKHIVEHDMDRIYSCETCGRKTKTVWELKQHQRSHQPRKCKQCDYQATNISDLRVHQRKNHLILNCSECDYACSTNWQLQRHKKTHNKEPSELFCCEHCGFSCHTKRQFSYHMIRHTNRTPFSCSQCDYKCSSRSSLSAHRLMHAGLKPFLCSFCGMSFRRSSHLNNHLLIHKDEKGFVCRTCGHPFRTRHNLKVHEMIHTGEKHHKCHLCPFACRRNKELRLHLEKHKHSANSNLTQPDTSFVIPKAELKVDESALPQEVFAAMFQVS